MQRKIKNRRTSTFSFSGIDGAGKSTQIDRLRANLQDRGIGCQVVSFWEHAACFTWLRTHAGHALFRGDLGVGRPDAPIHRRDKDVESWMMTAIRLLLYLADALSLRLLVRRLRSSRAEAIIFDRYIDDELANLALQNPAMRAYAAVVARLAPRPDVSFILDADPALAQARKPEYPLEFLHRNRRSFLALSELAGGIAVIAPGPAGRVEREVLAVALQKGLFAQRAGRKCPKNRREELHESASAAAGLAVGPRQEIGSAVSPLVR